MRMILIYIKSITQVKSDVNKNYSYFDLIMHKAFIIVALTKNSTVILCHMTNYR